MEFCTSQFISKTIEKKIKITKINIDKNGLYNNIKLKIIKSKKISLKTFTQDWIKLTQLLVSVIKFLDSTE